MAKKNLCVFLDGTLNNPEGRKPLTNVYKLFLLTSDMNERGRPQIKFYTSGVGTYSSLDKIWTVPIGKGVQVNIRLAYQWFPGYHLDVGGGATVNGKSAGSGSLSDVTPQWMMDEARTKCLGISNPDAKFLPFHPDPEGIRHKSDWRTTPLIKRPRQYASSMSQNTQSGANVSPPLEAAPFKRVWIWLGAIGFLVAAITARAWLLRSRDRNS